jgi:hypothetical protein
MVDNIQLFFNTQVSIDLTDDLNTLNELIPLDTKTIYDLVLKFYTLSYSRFL